MNTEHFIEFVQNPASLGRSTLKEIDEWLEDYPFFQTARLLRIKNLQNIYGQVSKEELGNTAAYISDRKMLYYLLHSPNEPNPQGSPREEVTDGIISGRDYKESMQGKISNIVTRQLNDLQVDRDSKMDITPGLAIDVRKEYGEIEDEAAEKKEPKRTSILVSDLLELDEDMATSEMESDNDLSFELEDGTTIHKEFSGDDGLPKDKLPTGENDNLKEIKAEIPYDLNQLVSSGEAKGDLPPSHAANDLIDRFIEANPKIEGSAAPGGKNEDISADSVKEHESFFTDTLARIYVKQGNYAKAIMSYEKLSLKYPEKSTYFAGQIAEIKKLLNK